MNQKSQKRKILRFLSGKINKEIDIFCIYQWIERCYFHEWCKLAVALGSHVPPNSLDQHFHKRLEYLLSECRSKLKEQNKQIELERPELHQPFTFTIKLQVSPEEATAWLNSISNRKLERALINNWHCNQEGYVSAQSVLWLYCWAKTGMGSEQAAQAAQSVFDRIFPFTYGFFDSRLDHEWARKM